MNKLSPIFKADGVSACYAGREILRDVTVAIHQGESVALIGPNGCGKSTLFRVVVGLLPASAGTVILEEQDLARTDAVTRIRLGIGYLKQTKNIFTGLTVEENLTLAGEAVNGDGGESGSRRQRLMEAFPALCECLDKRAGLLSGGQRQALAMAMVLMRPAKLLLLDEPVAGLSPAAGKALLDALESLRREEGFSTVIVEHRLRQVQPHVNRVLVMREGRIVDDTPDTERMLDAAWLAGHYTNGNTA